MADILQKIKSNKEKNVLNSKENNQNQNQKVTSNNIDDWEQEDEEQQTQQNNHSIGLTTIQKIQEKKAMANQNQKVKAADWNDLIDKYSDQEELEEEDNNQEDFKQSNQQLSFADRVKQKKLNNQQPILKIEEQVEEFPDLGVPLDQIPKKKKVEKKQPDQKPLQKSGPKKFTSSKKPQNNIKSINIINTVDIEDTKEEAKEQKNDNPNFSAKRQFVNKNLQNKENVQQTGASQVQNDQAKEEKEKIRPKFVSNKNIEQKVVLMDEQTKRQLDKENQIEQRLKEQKDNNNNSNSNGKINDEIKIQNQEESKDQAVIKQKRFTNTNKQTINNNKPLEKDNKKEYLPEKEKNQGKRNAQKVSKTTTAEAKPKKDTKQVQQTKRNSQKFTSCTWDDQEIIRIQK